MADFRRIKFGGEFGDFFDGWGVWRSRAVQTSAINMSSLAPRPKSVKGDFGHFRSLQQLSVSLAKLAGLQLQLLYNDVLTWWNFCRSIL